MNLHKNSLMPAASAGCLPWVATIAFVMRQLFYLRCCVGTRAQGKPVCKLSAFRECTASSNTEVGNHQTIGYTQRQSTHLCHHYSAFKISTSFFPQLSMVRALALAPILSYLWFPWAKPGTGRNFVSMSLLAMSRPYKQQAVQVLALQMEEWSKRPARNLDLYRVTMLEFQHQNKHL